MSLDPDQSDISRVRLVPLVTTVVDLPRAQACRCSAGKQTVLTVLTQKLPFLSGNWNESYWRGPLLTEAHGRWQAARSFRYAPLLSGSDIICKSLGRHEIAAIQSTEVRHRELHRSGSESAWWQKYSPKKRGHWQAANRPGSISQERSR